TGAPALTAAVNAVLRDVLTRPRDPEKLARDVADMRARIAGQHPTDRTWDLKHVRGGLVDLDFIAQYLQLRHAAAHPEIRSTNPADALARMGAAGDLEQAVADALIAADRLWRRLQGLLRLTVREELDEAAIPEGLRRSLAEAG